MPYYGPHRPARQTPQVAKARLDKMPYRVFQAATNGLPEARAKDLTIYVADFGENRYTATAAEVTEYKQCRADAYPHINF